MINKQLIINLVSNIIAFSSSFIISFILTPYLIGSIGKAAYSFYPLSNNLIGYLAIVTLALNSMVSRFISVHFNKGDYERSEVFYSSAFFANIFVILLLSLPVIFFVINIEVFLNIPDDLVFDVKVLFSLVFFSLLIDLISSVFSVATFVSNRMELRAISEFLKNIFKVLLFLVLFLFFEVSVIFIGVVAIAVSLLNLLIQYVYSKKLLPSFSISLSMFSLTAIKTLLSAGIWNVINALGVSLLLGMALLLTNWYLGAEASGDLSLALLLPAFITGIISMLSSVLLPKMTQVHAAEGGNFLIEEVLFNQKILSVLTTIPICIVIIFSDDFFKLWIPTEYSNVITNLSIILLFPLLIHSNMWSIYSVNIVVNKLKKLSLLLLLLGVVNIFINIFWFHFFYIDIYVIPLTSVAINIIYYLFIVPVKTSYNLNIRPLFFYPQIFKSIIFSLVYIFISLEFSAPVSNWYDLFFYSVIFGVSGLFIHLLIVMSKRELKLCCSIFTKVT